MKGGKARRVITSFSGAGQKRSASEIAAEKQRKEKQKIIHALRSKS